MAPQIALIGVGFVHGVRVGEEAVLLVTGKPVTVGLGEHRDVPLEMG